MAWPTSGCKQLIDAMVKAEGGPSAMVRAVRISIPSVSTYQEAREIAANTIARRLWDLHMSRAGALEEFVVYLGQFWAPVGADNDPTNLNKNWVPNVLAELRRGG